eukprot:gene27525-33231_t
MYPVGHHVRVAPVSNFDPRSRQCGSLSNVFPVIRRRLWITDPYIPTALVESLPPGGSSMNGMNLSGNPGIVHPMQI